MVQRFLKDPKEPETVWMGDGPGFWREHGDWLMAKWDKEHLVPPSNVIELVSTLANEQPLEYSVADLTERIRRGRTSQDDANSTAANMPSADTPPYVVPQILHFYWAGRDIDQGKVDNLTKWAMAARNSAWRIWIWHDGAVAKARNTGKLRGEITVMKITMSVIDPSLRYYYDAFIKARNYPAASDLARYSILLRYGGVYADVDVGPGDMDFSRPLVLEKKLPIQFGPQLRDAQAVLDALKIVEAVQVTPEMVQAAAKLRRKEGSFGNHFIAVPPGSPILRKLVTLVSARLKKLMAELHEQAGNAAVLTGQGAIAQHLANDEIWMLIRDRYFKNGGLGREEVIGAVFDQLVTEQPLEWLTPESEDQQEH
jgi:mannosyltransferase OCH1-like enzyme